MSNKFTSNINAEAEAEADREYQDNCNKIKEIRKNVKKLNGHIDRYIARAIHENKEERFTISGTRIAEMTQIVVRQAFLSPGFEPNSN
jgi:hypothetical protein